nr:FecR family protein [uncultured Pedobacter sp.]
MENSKDIKRYRYLASKWFNNTISENELIEFNDWYNSNLDTPLDIPNSFAASEPELEARMFKKLNDKFEAEVTTEDQEGKISGRLKIKWATRIAAAASIIIAVAAGLWLYNARTIKPQSQILSQTNDIAPGKNTATLTFSSGKTIQLSDKKKGIFINASYLKYNDGSTVGSSASPEISAMGVVEGSPIIATTPKGGTYQVVLPDGTEVWLNADSKLVFPSKFTGNNRVVTLTGEAYFEVAKNKSKPFIVNTGASKIEVLGTHFNIMAYKDEADNLVTLLEGAVKVNSGTAKVLLKPGQQAEISRKNPSSIILNNEIDTEQIIAWKNGYFMFANEPVESIMRKISRWYNVDIVYQDNLQDKALWGTVSRFKNVSEVLKRLELTGVVRFKIDNLNANGKERRIIVMK